MNPLTTEHQIEQYIQSIAQPKRSELKALHDKMLKNYPDTKLWFLDGLNEQKKVVSNPNIGYGTFMMNYSNGSTKEFYRVGLSANTTGISVYLMGIEDRNFLKKEFGDRIGKATITGYCIKFKKSSDINLDVLSEAIDFCISK